MITQPTVQSVVAPVVIGTMDHGFGVSYYKVGLVMDYGTVGEFTVVDKSPEGNDGTLYSGRGVSTDGVNDKALNIADGAMSGIYMTVWVRPVGTTASVYCGSFGGGHTFTGLLSGVWQQISTDGILAEVDGLILGWDGASDYTAADWADVYVESFPTIPVSPPTHHWTLADWSDPTAGGLDGKPIVDSGPNDLHGTCTGCTGFTGEGIDPAVASIVGYDDKMFFDGVDDYVQLDSTISLAVGEYVEAACYWQSGDRIYLAEDTPVEVDFLTVTDTGVVLFRLDGVIHTHTEVVTGSGQTILRLERTAASSYTLTVNGSSEGFATANAPISLRQIGGTSNIGLYFTGLTLSVDYNGTAVWTNTGTSSGTGYTVNGNPVTVGQKRVTIPQTAGQNWNKGALALTDVVNTDFSAGTGGFVFPTNGTLDAPVSVAGVADALSFTNDGVSGVHRAYANVAALGTKEYKVSFKCYIPSSNTVMKGLVVKDGSNGIESPLQTATDVWTDVEYMGVAAGSSRVYFTGTTISGTTVFSGGVGDVIYLKDLVVTEYIANWLVSASDADDQIDALGNPILEPRLNNQQLNLFGEGEYSRTPDSDSLDLTTAATWEIWGNFYGDEARTKVFFSDYDTGSGQRSWNIVNTTTESVDTARIVLSSIGTGPSFIGTYPVPDEVVQLTIAFEASAIVVYVNAAPVTVTTVSGSVPASLFVSSSDISIGANNGDTLINFFDNKIGSPKIYNVALTADEVLQNFNAQKSKYGL